MDPISSQMPVICACRRELRIPRCQRAPAHARLNWKGFDAKGRVKDPHGGPSEKSANPSAVSGGILVFQAFTSSRTLNRSSSWDRRSTTPVYSSSFIPSMAGPEKPWRRTSTAFLEISTRMWSQNG